MVSKAQIAKLKEPSIKLVDLVTTEMLSMCKDATGKVTTRDITTRSISAVVPTSKSDLIVSYLHPQLRFALLRGRSVNELSFCVHQCVG